MILLIICTQIKKIELDKKYMHMIEEKSLILILILSHTGTYFFMPELATFEHKLFLY